MGVTPAMLSGSSLTIMQKEMPKRVFDVGIAEQHAVTFSAGMAISGKLPFCNIYSTFMQRAFDGVIHDVAIQKLNVIFCLDRGGLVGDDGETHHGVFDLAYMRNIPNMIVSAPMDAIELRNMMFTFQSKEYGPVSIRYPRGTGSIIDWQKPFEKIEIGSAREISKGEKVAVLTIGITGELAKEAIQELEQEEKIQVQHYDMRFVKPLDKNTLHKVCKSFSKIITIEDGVKQGGFASAILEFMAEHHYTNKVKVLGIPDYFIPHGTQQELYKECGFDKDSIKKEIKLLWE